MRLVAQMLHFNPRVAQLHALVLRMARQLVVQKIKNPMQPGFKDIAL
jgi:hypothetical protein